MVVPNQDNPFGSRLAMPSRFAGTTLNNSDPRLSLSKSVSTRIGRISQHLQKRVVDWNLPNHLALTRVPGKCWERYFFLPEPQQHLPNASQFRHLREDQLNGFLHPAVRVLLDLSSASPAQTHGQEELQLTRTGL